MKAKHDLKAIKSHFKNAVDLKHTCKIYLKTTDESSWSFYFKQGCLLWGSSSIHRFRRLYRLTNKICPEINCQDIRLREQEITELWEYLLISVLQKRQLIDLGKAKKIVQQNLDEVLLDCFLTGDLIEDIKVIFETQNNSMGAILRSPLFEQPIIKINYQKSLGHIERLVSEWKTIDITNFSPNLAPAILDIDKLKRNLDVASYDNLFRFINGNKTIRDLAILSQEDPLNVARSLLPYLKSKAIALQEIPDCQLANLYFLPSDKSKTKQYNSRNRVYIKELDLPLIVLVDCNPHYCQKITQILNPAGYRVMAVSDAAKSLIALLENRPDLIILDEFMPDANGYELCTQIRKMPEIKNIPIILMHHKEGMMNGVKARMSGATDSLLKSVVAKQILILVQKHTQNFVAHGNFITS